MNHKDINLISFFNNGIICFIIDIYSDDQQNALKYLKDIEINLNNVLIMTENFNIRDNDWDLSYSHHLVHTDILTEINDSFDLRLFISDIQVLTWYINNSNDSNFVIDLIFLRVNLEEIDTHSILSDLQSFSDYALLIVDIIISKEFIQDKY